MGDLYPSSKSHCYENERDSELDLLYRFRSSPLYKLLTSFLSARSAFGARELGDSVGFVANRRRSISCEAVSSCGEGLDRAWIRHPMDRWLFGSEFDRMGMTARSSCLNLASVTDPARWKDLRVEMEGTVFTPALEVMNNVKSKDGSLEAKYASDPSKFEHLYSMVQVEVESKTSSSCTNGLLWLTRAMDFLVELFCNLLEHPAWTMSQACTESYSKTLKKWHGWLARFSFSIGMKLAPDRKKFMEVIGGSGDINADMEKFCANFSYLLAENHRFLASVGLDDLKAS
ncbi:glycolipid transfer protein 1-like isoform X2 [Phoenix dactylifera]|uniref:Glycolipid transfer protein 1-like isoform X2 n=1 Tax=Phoenix dactylifera TaxID=42345 RepID=A0A8B7MTG0_PHODC|nr:glycolipid transfer protein 1-like isoform X2 [Phoenix dactylifera]